MWLFWNGDSRAAVLLGSPFPVPAAWAVYPAPPEEPSPVRPCRAVDMSIARQNGQKVTLSGCTALRGKEQTVKLLLWNHILTHEKYFFCI